MDVQSSLEKYEWFFRNSWLSAKRHLHVIILDPIDVPPPDHAPFFLRLYDIALPALTNINIMCIFCMSEGRLELCHSVSNLVRSSICVVIVVIEVTVFSIVRLFPE